jgi:hypothetical protein
MPKSDLSFLDTKGEEKNLYGPVKLDATQKKMADYGARFALALRNNLEKSKNVSEGNLADSVDPVVSVEDGSIYLRMFMLDYYDFINKGVKGVKSSSNAPGSPYKFKNFGVPDTMKRSLAKYIKNNKGRVRNVKKDVAFGIGNEAKGKRLTEEQTQVNALGYMIKRQGIKSTMYFDKAFKETFKGFEQEILDSFGTDVTITLSGIKLGKKR